MPRSSPQRHSASYRLIARLALAAPALVAAEAQASPPATAPGRPRFGDVELATGVRLHYLEQGDPAGRRVIMLHGITDSWFSFSRVLSGLSARHRVYALDLRGHGDSERPADGYATHEMAADVIAFMDAMGLDRATLVGHSMGSFVAQQVALAVPERVAGLVLVGSGTTVRNEVTEDLMRVFDSLPETVPEDFALEFQRSTVHQPVPEEFILRAAAESCKVPARVWRSALAGLLAMERFSGLRGGDTPTFIVWGDRDGMFSRTEQEALVAVLPVASLRVYRATGHAPHWERPKEFVRDLESFLRTAPA